MNGIDNLTDYELRTRLLALIEAGSEQWGLMMEAAEGILIVGQVELRSICATPARIIEVLGTEDCKRLDDQMRQWTDRLRMNYELANDAYNTWMKG